MNEIAAISSAFLSARREARAIENFPGEIPGSLDEAYKVQAKSTAAWGEPVIGYKVGGIGPQWRDQYPSSWLAGPVFPSLVFEVEDQGTVDVGVFNGGLAAYEPELLMRLTGLSELKDPVDSIEQAKRYVSAVHIGAEIASSPLATLNALGPGAIISDFGNQAGIVIGPEIEREWLERLDQLEVTMVIDAEVIGRKAPNPDERGPLGALRFLLNHLLAHGGGIVGPDAIWLSSGAITGVHESISGTIGRFDYGSLGCFDVAMKARKPLTV